MYKNNLDLGWCQGYMGLQYHMEDALIEKHLDLSLASWCPPIAIFSEKYYNEINELNHEKKYDFCFIGSINSSVNNRKWVIDFAKKHFTNNSIFVNTDNNPNWILLGVYDYSNKKLGFVLKTLPPLTSLFLKALKELNPNKEKELEIFDTLKLCMVRGPLRGL